MSDDILRRAAAEARSASEPGWVDISASIQQKLRSVTRRSRPILAEADNGGPLYVADHVLVSHLRVAVNALPGCELARVSFVGEGGHVTGAVVEVMAPYGQDLAALAARIRTLTFEVVTELLGPVEPPFGTDGIDVTVTDLTDLR
ncbi:hypothetical protein [Kribbella sp. CA-293567]|uniref:hypothetical protein n=1 Tax=Kribbella sp. CA-293567 TaxID=3002436 RepID=UPI0022DD1033|nr:hypothetical protein [Kribbella sp. CA-293567]WBQ04666.1 hypothetical protein OX958_32480 [Kribbella sp. CA-293567]